MTKEYMDDSNENKWTETDCLSWQFLTLWLILHEAVQVKVDSTTEMEKIQIQRSLILNHFHCL